MKNTDVAEIFENIADLMEIRGGDTYRVRAYRRAAIVIGSLAEDLEEISKRGELEALPGIGESIADKIRDILETGTTPAYEELQSQFPVGLIDMLHIPDVGPRTVKAAYEKLGVKSIEELEEAAKQGRIANEKALGKKVEETILRGLEMLGESPERLSLGVAWPLADDVVERLKKSPNVKQISVAGSIRRRKDTIGDIDIVAETSDAKETSELFASLPQVRKVIEIGPSMSSVWTKAGLRMDLRVASEEHYGAMLHHFTGGKQHNIRLRGLARDQGLTINEYGVFNVKTGKQIISGRTEEDIYAALALPWIPPELREDQGEIEAAIRGRLPNLIDIGDIKGDLHVHSRHSDGKNSIEEMAQAAQARGYQYIAICDHSHSLAIAHGLSEERLLQEIEEIKALNRKLDGFRILCGIEVDIRSNGTLDTDPEVLKQLDIVVASLHQRYRLDREQTTRRILKAFETGLVDIFAHPTGRLINQREPYDVDMERVFDAAKANSVAMEINSYPDRLDLNDIYARAAMDRGLKLSINTDAHTIPDYDNIRFGLALARRGWLEPSNVLNTLPLDELQTWLSTRG